jgi:branched-chain amino acid transport system permease protein
MSAFPEPVAMRSPRVWLVAAVIAFFALVPVYAVLAKEPFYLTLFGRIMIYALAAVALNLLIGVTGLVSLGHAMFIGLGAYAVSIPSFHGITNGWAHLAFAVGGSAVVAYVTGKVVLRTQGMGFIMITLAFAQMFFFLGISLKQYGGDDGMRLERRSNLFPLDLASAPVLYYVIFACLIAAVYFSWRLVHGRFGYVLQGVKANERRMKALGFDTQRYKLAVYVISACITSVAGFLLANLTSYASPSYTAWTVSGDLVVMVVLGGMHTVFGPLVGAAAFLLFEEALQNLPKLSASTAWMADHWMAALGLSIVIIVLTVKKGLYGSFYAWAVKREGVRKPMREDERQQAGKAKP